MIRIEEDKLIREEPVFADYDTVVAFRRQVVITKEEFIACYNAWIKEKKE